MAELKFHIYPIESGFHGPKRPVPSPELIAKYDYESFSPFKNSKENSDDYIASAAKEIRRDIIRSLVEAKSGHSGGPLGIADVMATLYFGGVRVKPKSVAALQRVVYDKYPTVSVINAADVLQIVQDVVDQIALVIRFISLFTILAGVIILASSVAGTRFRRIREVVILKTLGATRKRVAGIFSVEFLILGAVAGLIGGVLATGFSGLLLKRFFEGRFRFEPMANLLAVALTALISALRFEPCMLRWRSMLNLTAAASSGSPSWNLTPCRSFRTRPLLPSTHCHSVAS